MQPKMRCGWSRLVDGPPGKQGVKGRVEEFGKEEEGREKGRACEIRSEGTEKGDSCRGNVE